MAESVNLKHIEDYVGHTRAWKWFVYAPPMAMQWTSRIMWHKADNSGTRRKYIGIVDDGIGMVA